MIIEHKVKVKWAGMSRSHYENLGYKYSKKDEEFEVWSYELSPGSNIEVLYVCDYCGKKGNKQMGRIMDSRDVISKDCCQACAPKKHNEIKLIRVGSLESEYPEIAKEWCLLKNEVTPRSITPYSKRKAHWACEKGHNWVAAVYSRTHANTGCPDCNESKGERQVAEALDIFGIKYEREYYFDDLIGKGGGYLRYDFAVLNERDNVIALIEYDGPFHFKKHFEGDGHEKLVEHDRMKDKYCLENKIPLLRIPYTNLDNVFEEVNKFRMMLSTQKYPLHSNI